MPIPKTAIDLRSGGLRGTAYDQLLDAIVCGELKPGQRLYDEDLETRFGTIRSAIRAALVELENQWLVRIVPRKGTFVTEFDLSRGLQAAEVLAQLTMRAMEDAAGHLTPEHLDRLSTYRDRWLRLPEAMREALLTSQEDDGLYGVFFAATENQELVRVRDWVMPSVKRLRHHLVETGEIDVDQALKTQRAVIAAVLDGDLEQAAGLLWENSEPLFGEYIDENLTIEPPRPAVALTRDLVADTIERAILDGTLIPDEPLPESDLMAWLGVSHTPVRQALDELANRGLVEQRLNKSARVARLDPATIRHTFIAYGVLICVAYRRALQLDPAKLLAALRPHHDRYQLEPKTPLSEINAGINSALFEFSGAQVIAELSGRMASRLTWYNAVVQNDEKLRSDAVRLVAETQEAIASDDREAMVRIIKEAYDELPFGD